MEDSNHKLQGVRAGHRPERRSAGSYSYHDDDRVDRVGGRPAAKPIHGEGASSRRRTKTSDIARVNLRPQLGDTPDNDVRPVRESSDRMTSPSSRTAATGATEQDDDATGNEALPRSLKDSLPEMDLPPSLPMQDPPTAKTKQPPLPEAPRSERKPAATVQMEPGWETEFEETGRTAAPVTVPAPSPDASGAAPVQFDLGLPAAPALPSLEATGRGAEEPDETFPFGAEDGLDDPLALEPLGDEGAESPLLDFDAAEDEPTATVDRPYRPSMDWMPEPSPVTTAKSLPTVQQPSSVSIDLSAPVNPTMRDTPPIMSNPAPEQGAEDESGPVEPPLPRNRSASERELFLGLEDAVSRGDWAAVHAAAGATAAEPEADPALVLVDALACRELGQGREADAAHQQRAIRAMERLLQLDGDSPVALLLAKRMLRRPPGFAQSQPKAPLSVAVLFAGLALGTGAGWLVTRLLF